MENVLYRKYFICFTDNMKRRLFIGIPVAREANKGIDRKIDSFRSLPISWVSEENRHITVFFLGWVDDRDIPLIVEKMRSAIRLFSAFDVFFDRICLVPEGNPNRVEMTGEKNDDLRDLFNAVAKNFERFFVDRKKFHPHITLGRIRRKQWSAVLSKTRIDVSIRFSLPIFEVSLFESFSEEGKLRYVPIETTALSG